MRIVFLSLIISFILLAQKSLSCDMEGKTGIVPENDLWIGPEEKGVSTITEREFNQVLDRIEEIYRPIFEEKGATLDMQRYWENGKVNAYAMRRGDRWVVAMFGGLARHETITKDGFALVACHEIGHHIGGFPKKTVAYGTQWASNEGQADYFGTSKCLRKYMEHDNNQSLVKNVSVDNYVTEQCSKSFKDEEDIALCQRTSLAGLSLAELFSSLRRSTVEVKFDTPDPKVVTRTYDGHPEPQCRLDTYFNGSVCDKDHFLDFDTEEYSANNAACSRKEGYIIGLRPLCWYRPQES
jgi:hypothetical protein